MKFDSVSATKGSSKKEPFTIPPNQLIVPCCSLQFKTHKKQHFCLYDYDSQSNIIMMRFFSLNFHSFIHTKVLQKENFEI